MRGSGKPYHNMWENPPYGSQYLSICPSLRPIAHSVSEIFSLLCVDARTIKLEKLRSKGVAMRAHAFSVYY